MKKKAESFAGIDISKTWLDGAVHEQADTFRSCNNAEEIAMLVKRLKKLKPALIVLEPTGGPGTRRM